MHEKHKNMRKKIGIKRKCKKWFMHMSTCKLDSWCQIIFHLGVEFEGDTEALCKHISIILSCATSNFCQCMNSKCTYMDLLARCSEQWTCQLSWQPLLFSVVYFSAFLWLGKFGLEVCILWKIHTCRENFTVCMDSWWAFF